MGAQRGYDILQLSGLVSAGPPELCGEVLVAPRETSSLLLSSVTVRAGAALVKDYRSLCVCLLNRRCGKQNIKLQ